MSTLNLRNIPAAVHRKAALLAANGRTSIKGVVIAAIDQAWERSLLAKTGVVVGSDGVVGARR
jgi:hypothetical protein